MSCVHKTALVTQSQKLCDLISLSLIAKQSDEEVVYLYTYLQRLTRNHFCMTSEAVVAVCMQTVQHVT